MNTKTHHWIALLILQLSITMGGAQTVQPALGPILIESQFKGGATEGWRGANDGGLQQVLKKRRGELVRQDRIVPEKAKPAGGKNKVFVSGGHIILSEGSGDGKTLYFQAPSKFSGNLKAAYGGFLTFGIRQTGDGQMFKDAPLIVLSSKTIILFYFPEKWPGATWERFQIPFYEKKGWYNMTTGEKLATTKQDFEAVLGTVSELWIRAEYTVGSDRAELAEVQLHSKATR